MSPQGSQQLLLISDRKSMKDAVEWDPWETAFHFVLRNTHSERTVWLFSFALENISRVPVTCLLCRSSLAGRKKQFKN